MTAASSHGEEDANSGPLRRPNLSGLVWGKRQITSRALTGQGSRPPRPSPLAPSLLAGGMSVGRKARRLGGVTSA